MKKFLILLSMIFTVQAFSGTLIYRNSQKEKKIISEIEIVSIDKNIITFQIGKTTRTLPFSSMIKYYDTDINLNLAFDDNTAEYGVYATNIKLPVNQKGITTRKSGKKAGRETNKITLDYSVQMKKKKNQRDAIKAPYFYLYVLVASNKHSGTSLYCYSYPESAKLRNSRNYNEALMMEKALSSERPNYNSNFTFHSNGMLKSNRTATFELKGIGNRNIIAYHLVVWGKDDIVFTQNRIINHGYGVSKNWLIHARNNK